MKKVLIVAGPTASGKTDFAIELAKKLNTEIISGDSIQVYQGLDIGSGKVTKEQMQGISHHLIDILSPKEEYSVADFQEHARKLIDEMTTVPIIAGGTGLYLKACLYDYVFSKEGQVRVDESLESLTNHELYEMLLEKDPVQAEKIHENNRQRLLRSLTILKQTGQKQSELEQMQKHEPIYDIFIAGCTMDREVLYDRINQRVAGMMKEGLENEVKHLLDEGVTFQDACMKGIGYREWEEYFKGNMTVNEVQEMIARNSRRYAKRQYTWFHHQLPVHWFNPLNEEEYSHMQKEMIAFARGEGNE